MEKVMIVVLNYHSNEHVLNLMKGILELENDLNYDVYIGSIMETAEEKEQLQNAIRLINSPEHINIYTLAIDENLGYARGNNSIIKYAINNTKAKYDYILIANPDIILNDSSTVSRLVDIFTQKDNVALVGPKIMQIDGGQQGPYKKQGPLVAVVKYLFPYVWYPIMKLNEKKINAIAEPVYVWRVMGCFMLTSFEVFQAVGFFNENTFMYCEEDLLSLKFEKIGKKVVFDPHCMVVHNHKKMNDFYTRPALDYLIDSNRVYFSEAGYSKCSIEIKIFTMKIHASIRNFVKKYLVYK